MGRKSGMMMCMVIMVVMLGAVVPRAEGTMSCSDVVRSLSPCIAYAMGTGQLTNSCCSGVHSVYDAAKTTADRKAVCECLKQVSGAAGSTRVNSGNIQSLPKRCGVTLPYKISPTMNCATVS